jgi:hypothetical protein
MAWEDIFAGIGGGLGGVGQAYQQKFADEADERKLAHEQKMQALMLEVEKAIAKGHDDTSRDNTTATVEGSKAVEGLRQGGENTRLGITESGADRRLGMTLTADEKARAMNDATQRFIADGGFKNQRAVAEIQAAAQRYGYDKQAASAGNALDFEKRKFPVEMGMKGFEIEQYPLRNQGSMNPWLQQFGPQPMAPQMGQPAGQAPGQVPALPRPGVGGSPAASGGVFNDFMRRNQPAFEAMFSEGAAPVEERPQAPAWVPPGAAGDEVATEPDDYPLEPEFGATAPTDAAAPPERAENPMTKLTAELKALLARPTGTLTPEELQRMRAIAQQLAQQ